MSQFVVYQAIHTHYLLINSLKQSLSLWWCLVIIGVSPPSSASWSWHRNTKAISRGPCKDSTTHKRQLDKSALIERDYIAIHENNILWLALKCWLTETIHMFFSSLDWDNLFSKKEKERAYLQIGGVLNMTWSLTTLGKCSVKTMQYSKNEQTVKFNRDWAGYT